MILSHNGVTVKIETNYVLRGTVYPTETRELSDMAYNTFKRFVAVQTLSVADLYGSKLCAALDRQHPRDFYDVKILLDETGISQNILQAFLVYLISHPRPINELLNPNFKDINHIFANEFEGMTREKISLHKLVNTQHVLPGMVLKMLSNSDREFLMSFKQMQPKWDLLGISGVQDMPAVQWKLRNLSRMTKKKHEQAATKLKICLHA